MMKKVDKLVNLMQQLVHQCFVAEGAQTPDSTHHQTVDQNQETTNTDTARP